MRRFAVLVALVAGLVALLAVSAQSALAGNGVACGDTVSGYVKLTHNLDCTGTSHGLIIGADNTTINLNRYRIQGTGCTAGWDGISNQEGYDSLTIKRGTVADFCENIETNDGADGGTNNVRILKMRLECNGLPGNCRGALVRADSGVAIRNSTAIGSTGNGFTVEEDTCGSGCITNVLIENNLAIDNSPGFRFEGINGGIVRYNKSIRNRTSGFVMSQTLNTMFKKNVAAHNGDRGFSHGSGAGTRFIANSAIGNQTQGFWINAGQILLKANVAARNHGHGFLLNVDANYAKLIGNRASKNGGDGFSDANGLSTYMLNSATHNTGYGILSSLGATFSAANFVLGNGMGCSAGIHCFPQN